MSADGYIQAIFKRKSLSSTFDNKFGSDWLPAEDFKKIFRQAFDEVFMEFGFLPPDNCDQREVILAELLSQGGIIKDGDEYTGIFFGLNIPIKDQAFTEFLNSSVEAVRLSTLGKMAEIRAVERSVDELGWTQAMSSPRTDDDTNAVPSDEVIIQASDRLVGLDHNSKDYDEVRTGIEGLTEEFRQSNAAGGDTEEKDRISRALDAANRLWAAVQLKVVQVRVGVLMAVDDAIQAIGRTGRSSAYGFLTDLIKRYVSDKTGLAI